MAAMHASVSGITTDLNEYTPEQWPSLAMEQSGGGYRRRKLKRRNTLKRKSKKKTKKTTSVQNEQVTQPAPQVLAGQVMNQQQPLDLAVAEVKEAMVDRSKRHLLHSRQRRLKEIQKAQFPRVYHEGTPMVPSYVSDIPQHKPNLYALGPAPQPQPESAVWEQRDPEPRDAHVTNVFLERTLQGIKDDRLREIGFKVLDMSGLEVQQSNEPDKIVLANKATGAVVVLSESEFMRAIEFLGDPARPPLVRADPKTRQLIGMLRPAKDLYKKIAAANTENILPGELLFGSMAGPVHQFESEQTKGMTEEQKKNYQQEVKLQINLDGLRDEFEPAREVKRKQTWLEWLRGKDPSAVDTERIVANIASEKDRQEAAQTLNDMKMAGLIDWDSEGHIVDPQRNGIKLKNSNIVNIVKHVFSLSSAETREHLSQYSPTGIEFFIQRTLKALTLRQKDPKSPLLELAAKQPGRIFPMTKHFEGKSYSLVKMYSILEPYLSVLGITRWLWFPVALYMNSTTFQQFAWIYNKMNLIGQGNPLTNTALSWLAPTADSVLTQRIGISSETRAQVQNTIYEYGDQIGWGLFSGIVTTVSSFASALFTVLLGRNSNQI